MATTPRRWWRWARATASTSAPCRRSPPSCCSLGRRAALADAVAALNRAEAERLGEPHRIVDRAALDVAVKRPWNVWVYFMDRDFATLAMTLLVAIVGAKAFAAANERTAYRAALALLEINGCTVNLGDHRGRAEEQLFDYFRGRLSQAGVRAWFENWMVSTNQ